MAQGSRKLDDLLRVLRWVDAEFLRGRPIAELAAELGFTTEELIGLASIFSVDDQTLATLSNCNLMDCVLPICTDAIGHDTLQQVASGVLVEIGPELFILTAAHVVHPDLGNDLFIPTKDGMNGIDGWSSHTIPDHQPGREDRLDFGYLRLAESMRDRIHPSIKPAQLDQLASAGESQVGDLYTFAGYPWRKSRSHASVVQTELVTFSGFVTSDEKYDELGYNRKEHIVVRFGRKRAYSSKFRSKKISPHPQGISGGVAIKWPVHPKDRNNAALLRITGIAHSYHESQKCIVATDIRCVMMAIIGRHPHLRQFFAEQDRAIQARRRRRKPRNATG